LLFFVFCNEIISLNISVIVIFLVLKDKPQNLNLDGRMAYLMANK